MNYIRINQRAAGIVLAVLSIIMFSACKSEQHADRNSTAELPAAPVKVLTVKEDAPIRQVEVMGTVQAADSASIAARISGNITELPVNLGSRVKSGDLLVAISAGEITAQLLQAQAQLEQADRNLKREQALLQKNAATPETVKTLTESKRIAEAAFKEAKTMLSYTKIEAPFDGVITRKMANIGDLATPGKPLLQLENETRLQIIADIPETLVLGIQLGDELPVRIPSAGIDITGRVTEIAPSADPRSRTAPVKLAIEKETKIRSGQFARVSLPGSKGKAIMVPRAAVLPLGQMDRVFLVENNTALLQLVKTGLTYGDQVEILSGLVADDTIVVSGNAHLKDGQPVTVQ